MKPSAIHVNRPLRALQSLARPGTAIVLLLLALVAGNLLYAYLVRAQDPIAGAAGDLLYVATFDDYLDEWDLYQGQQSATIVDGQLRLSLASAQTAIWSTAIHRFLDFDITVDASAAAGPIDNGFGIVFAVHKPAAAECALPAVVLCGIGSQSPLLSAALQQAFAPTAIPSFYLFLISSDGYYTLERFVDDKSDVISAWIPSPYIHQGLGARNQIRIIARESILTFYINGAQVSICIPNEPGESSTYTNDQCIAGTMVDSYHAPEPLLGQLGVTAKATPTGGGGLVIDFDNITVFSPSPSTIPTEGEDARL